jgi:uncharacterized membrane protein
MIAKLRFYFFAGLISVLPLFVTFWLLFSIVRFIDGFCGRLINKYLLTHYGITIPGIGIILAASLLILVGFLVRHFLGHRVAPAIERWLLKFPFVRQVYPAAKQIAGFFLPKDEPTFKQVVLVEYPSKGIWSMGFVTNTGFGEIEKKTGRAMLHVLVATTPSPWTGFLIFIPKAEAVFLDISVEDAIKLIVSGGIIKPE